MNQEIRKIIREVISLDNKMEIDKKYLILYHSTDSDFFNTIDADNAKKGERFFNPLGNGLYFSTNPFFSKQFGKNTYKYLLPKTAKIKKITHKSWTESNYQAIVKSVLRQYKIDYWKDLNPGQMVELMRLGNNTPITSLNELEYVLSAPDLGYNLDNVQETIEKVVDKINSKYDAIWYKDTDYYTNADEILIPKSKFNPKMFFEELSNEMASEFVIEAFDDGVNDGISDGITKLKKIIKEVINDNVDLLFENYQKELISEGQFIDKIKSLISKVRSSGEARNLFSKILRNIKMLPRRNKIEILALFFVLTSAFTSFYDLKSEIPADLRSEVEKELATDSIASNDSIRDITPELVDFLAYEEGSVINKRKPELKPYELGDGKVTIGYGHTGDNKEDITYAQALSYLKEDILEARDGLNRILDAWEEQGINPDIDQGKYNAMVSMIFNMGIGNFRMSNFIQLVKQNKIEEASNEILKTNLKYGDSNEDRAGLKNRRAREKQMFDGNLQV